MQFYSRCLILFTRGKKMEVISYGPSVNKYWKAITNVNETNLIDLIYETTTMQN